MILGEIGRGTIPYGIGFGTMVEKRMRWGVSHDTIILAIQSEVGTCDALHKGL